MLAPAREVATRMAMAATITVTLLILSMVLRQTIFPGTVELSSHLFSSFFISLTASLPRSGIKWDRRSMFKLVSDSCRGGNMAKYKLSLHICDNSGTKEYFMTFSALCFCEGNGGGWCWQRLSKHSRLRERKPSLPSNSGSVWPFRIGWGGRRVNSFEEFSPSLRPIGASWEGGFSSASLTSARIGAAVLSRLSVVSIDSSFFKRCLFAASSWSLEDKALFCSRLSRFSWPAASLPDTSWSLFSSFSRGGRARTKWTLPEK